MRTKYLSLLAMTAAVLVLTGCGHAMVTPQFVDLQTENVTIEVADGDWTIAPGELFKPQEVSALSPHGPMKAREIQSNLSMYTVATGTNTSPPRRWSTDWCRCTGTTAGPAILASRCSTATTALKSSRS